MTTRQPAAPKALPDEHIGDRLFRLRQRFRHDDTLACRQAVGLDDNRSTLLAQVGEGRFQFGEIGVRAGRDVVPCQEIFGEGFGAFQLRGALVRSEAAQAARLKVVHYAGDQGGLGAHDGQSHSIVLSEIRQCGEIHHIDGHVFKAGFLPGAGIAGGNIDRLHVCRLGSLPRQCVLAAAAADDQNIHADSLVSEVAHPGKHHRHAMFIGGGDHLFIANGATRLDNSRNARLAGVVDTVPEGEESVRGHHRAPHRQAGVLGLDGGNAGGVDAAHLSGADADGAAVGGIDDGVGFDELRHGPGEQQILYLLFGGLQFADHAQIIARNHAEVAILHQQAAIDPFIVQSRHPQLTTCRRLTGVRFSCLPRELQLHRSRWGQ